MVFRTLRVISAFIKNWHENRVLGMHFHQLSLWNLEIFLIYEGGYAGYVYYFLSNAPMIRIFSY